MSIVVRDMSYHYFNQQSLFEHSSFSVAPNRKVSVIGNNGTGKSTLLKLLAGKLAPFSGAIHCSSQPHYIPQQMGITGQNISEALDVAEKINALRSICEGNGQQIHYDQLADDWEIESRCRAALDYWGLTDVDLDSSVDLLSGGEKSKVFLSGLQVHKPGIILLDEPTNHLDQTSRQKLYDFINTCKATFVIVSHDITLLNQVDATYELSEKGINVYGGNYTFYKEQKDVEEKAIAMRINSEKASLRQVRKKAQDVRERQERRSAQGEHNKKKGGTARIVINARGNLAENSTAKLKEKHVDLVVESQQKLTELRQMQRINCELKIDFEDSQLHNGKILVTAVDVKFGYAKNKPLWQTPLNANICSGERIRIIGDNGTGKTTLIKLLTGELAPSEGEIIKSNFSHIYLDQQYRQVYKDITILEIAEEYNKNKLLDHEIKLRLNRALFPKETWDKNCLTLSGGERMRLHLCCLMISNHIPDMFVLDEPTNNLDLSSLSILAQTIANYRGTLLVISHDRNFIDAIGITRTIELHQKNQERIIKQPLETK